MLIILATPKAQNKLLILIPHCDARADCDLQLSPETFNRSQLHANLTPLSSTISLINRKQHVNPPSIHDYHHSGSLCCIRGAPATSTPDLKPLQCCGLRVLTHCDAWSDCDLRLSQDTLSTDSNSIQTSQLFHTRSAWLKHIESAKWASVM